MAIRWADYLPAKAEGPICRPNWSRKVTEWWWFRVVLNGYVSEFDRPAKTMSVNSTKRQTRMEAPEPLSDDFSRRAAVGLVLHNMNPLAGTNRNPSPPHAFACETYFIISWASHTQGKFPNNQETNPSAAVGSWFIDVNCAIYKGLSTFNNQRWLVVFSYYYVCVVKSIISVLLTT